jgi:hypothetical protein
MLIKIMKLHETSGGGTKGPKVRSRHCPSREATHSDHEPAAVAPAVARDPPRGKGQ